MITFIPRYLIFLAFVLDWRMRIGTNHIDVFNHSRSHVTIVDLIRILWVTLLTVRTFYVILIFKIEGFRLSVEYVSALIHAFLFTTRYMRWRHWLQLSLLDLHLYLLLFWVFFFIHLRDLCQPRQELLKVCYLIILNQLPKENFDFLRLGRCLIVHLTVILFRWWQLLEQYPSLGSVLIQDIPLRSLIRLSVFLRLISHHLVLLLTTLITGKVVWTSSSRLLSK